MIDQLVAGASTWQHTTHTTNIHAPSRIRTHNLSRRAAADLRLRPRGHWDLLISPLFRFQIFSTVCSHTLSRVILVQRTWNTWRKSYLRVQRAINVPSAATFFVEIAKYKTPIDPMAWRETRTSVSQQNLRRTKTTYPDSIKWKWHYSKSCF